MFSQLVKRPIYHNLKIHNKLMNPNDKHLEVMYAYDKLYQFHLITSFKINYGVRDQVCLLDLTN